MKDALSASCWGLGFALNNWRSVLYCGTMEVAGELAKSVLVLKFAAYDFGKDGTDTNREALLRAAEAYYQTYETYKNERED
jgi:hypothetical protein